MGRRDLLLKRVSLSSVKRITTTTFAERNDSFPMRYTVLFPSAANQMLSLILALLLFSAPEPVHVQTRVEQAFAQLWSAEDAQKKAAKETLLSSGEMAVPSLLSLLDEIIAVPRNRFATGTEVGGMQAAERLDRALRYGNKKEVAEAGNDFFRLEITNRLKRDAVALLVELRAEAAIPRLIA